MSNIGQNKATDRVTVRNLTKTYGNAGLFTLFTVALADKVRGKRGRSTLEERPFHIARRALEAASRSVLNDSDREFEAPKFAPEDVAMVREVLDAHGPDGVLDMFNVIFRGTSTAASKGLEKAQKQVIEAQEHLAARRELFKPSKTAVAIGLAPSNATSALRSKPESKKPRTIPAPPPEGDGNLHNGDIS